MLEVPKRELRFIPLAQLLFTEQPLWRSSEVDQWPRAKASACLDLRTTVTVVPFVELQGHQDLVGVWAFSIVFLILRPSNYAKVLPNLAVLQGIHFITLFGSRIAETPVQFGISKNWDCKQSSHRLDIFAILVLLLLYHSLCTVWP